jgi:isopentenyl diphosphate isomerase/L-lactate dehydrogenase-like FMN-dependent dehydrogenase
MVPYAVPPLRALPNILPACSDSMKIFVDCSMDTGIDAFKALALGADAVSVGRAIMPALKSGGASGVKEFIERETENLRWAMAVTCSPDIRNIDSGVIYN